MNEVNKSGTYSLSIWPISEFGIGAARQLLDHGTCVSAALMDWNTELAQFVNRRIGQNIEVISQMTGCRGVREALEIEMQWMRETLADYQRETRTLFECNSRILESMTGVSERDQSKHAEPTMSPVRPASRREQVERVGAPAA
jgi:hypothetical protein